MRCGCLTIQKVTYRVYWSWRSTYKFKLFFLTFLGRCVVVFVLILFLRSHSACWCGISREFTCLYVKFDRDEFSLNVCRLDRCTNCLLSIAIRERTNVLQIIRRRQIPHQRTLHDELAIACNTTTTTENCWVLGIAASILAMQEAQRTHINFS